MSISAPFNYPYYTGTGISTDVPGLFPIALNGRPYIVDLLSGQFKRQSLKILRTQANTTNLPDETSLNPEDLWRRSQMTWHKGAGQQHLDREDSDPARFNRSQSASVWDKWGVTCLPEAQLGSTYSASVSTLVSTSTALYWTTNNAIKRAVTHGGAFADHTAAAGQNYTSSASDGHNVYFAKGTDGVYLTNKGVATAAVSWVTGTVSVIRWVKDRLMAAGGASVYNITTSPGTAGPTALPAALKTMANSDWAWVDFAEGQGQIYMGGYSGDKSLIFRTAVKPDGTGLDAPVAAGELPDGEVLNAMQGYLGYIILGTTKGVRFCTADGQGNLIIGPLLNTGPISVTHFEPQDRFVWFSWPDDGDFSGLGRMDLSTFTAPQAPAFATDLAAMQDDMICGGLVTFKGGLSFIGKPGPGLVTCQHYYAVDNYLADATLDTGELTYGIFDEKVGMWVDVRTERMPEGTSYEVFLSVDGGAFETLGTHGSVDTTGTTFQVNQKLGRKFEIRVALYPSDSRATAPTINRITLRSYAAPNRAEMWEVPLLLHETVYANGDVPTPLNVLEEINRIRGLVASKQLVTFQEGSETHAVFVEDYLFQPHHPSKDATFWQGVCLVTLKETSR